MRRPSEREFTLEAALEPAVAVEPRTTDERIDISVEYSAGTLLARMLPNGVQRVHRIAQDAPACDILPLVPHSRPESQ
jgi:hypothetical protein